MLKIRKILSLALVVVMLLSTVAVSAFALADDKTVGIILKADKTVAEIVPGAQVTVYLHLELADYAVNASDVQLYILYDSNVYTPDVKSEKFIGDWANYADVTNTALISPAMAAEIMAESTMTAEEKAQYNSSVFMSAAADADLGVTNKAGYAVTVGEDGISIPEYALTFNVTGDADAVKNGNINIAVCDTSNVDQSIKLTNNGKTAKRTPFDASRANILANMSAAAPSILKYDRAQIRFKGITATSGASTYEGTFDVRTIAKISEADFISTFESEAHAMAKGVIPDFGFVYAATSNVADFDLDTAKAVAEGGSAAGYVKKSVTYMQHNDGTDYTFTCLIADIADADKTDGVSCIAYVCYEGNYIYFDAAATVSYADLYQRMPA